MIRDHQDLITPLLGTKLFRFCPFEKFQDLIQTSEVYFRHITKFKDKEEGIHTIADFPIIGALQGSPYDEKQKDPFNGLFYVNCWTEGTPDDKNFWDIYAPGKDSVAIASSDFRIRCAFYSDKQNDVYMSHVNYIDRSSESTFKMPHYRASMIEKCYAKGVEEFSWEKEVRLMYVHKLAQNQSAPDGLRLHVDLNFLIEGIYVSPYASDFEIEKVKSLLESSNLDTVPIIQAILAHK